MRGCGFDSIRDNEIFDIDINFLALVNRQRGEFRHSTSVSRRIGWKMEKVVY